MNKHRLNIPFPEIRIDNPGIHIAQILIPLYSGPYGELTAISTYLYQSLITERYDKYLSESLECLAVVSMKHFRTLGKMIEQCGIKPKLSYTNDRGNLMYWSGKFAEYSDKPQIFLKRNIEDERQVLRFYKKAYEKIKDKGARVVLERIIADEESHINIFEDYLK